MEVVSTGWIYVSGVQPTAQAGDTNLTMLNVRMVLKTLETELTHPGNES